MHLRRLLLPGVLTFDDAIKLVYQRAKLTEEAYPDSYGMGVISGLTEREVKKAVELSHTEALPVYLSNINANSKLLCLDQLKVFIQLSNMPKSSAPEKQQCLKVAIPSHCPLMADVSQELLKLVGTFTLNNPKIPYLANHTGRILRQKRQNC